MVRPARCAACLAAVVAQCALNEGDDRSSDSLRLATRVIFRRVLLFVRVVSSRVERCAAVWFTLLARLVGGCPYVRVSRSVALFVLQQCGRPVSPRGVSAAAHTHAAPHNDKHWCCQPSTTHTSAHAPTVSADCTHCRTTDGRPQPTTPTAATTAASTATATALIAPLQQHTPRSYTNEVTAAFTPRTNGTSDSSEQQQPASGHQRHGRLLHWQHSLTPIPLFSSSHSFSQPQPSDRLPSRRMPIIRHLTFHPSISLVPPTRWQPPQCCSGRCRAVVSFPVLADVRSSTAAVASPSVHGSLSS